MRKIFLATIAVLSSVCTAFGQKTVFRPTEWNNTGHEYYGRMSNDRMYESENFVVFWGDLVGTNPATYPVADLRFNPRSIADTLETSFKRYITDLKFINNDPSANFGKYKTIVVVLGTFSGNDDRTTGFAHASSYSNTIGALFVHPAATRDGGALSHEYAHTLQMMMRIQENPGNGTAFAGYDWAGPFFETHANFMRAQVYPRMADLDLTLTRWMQTRHYMWSSNRHHYTNFHLMYYVQEKDGFDFTRRMWAESKNQEHPLETIKRLKGLTQEQMGDYLWGYAQRQVAFDYPIQWNSQVTSSNNFGTTIRNAYNGIRNSMPRYLSRQYTILTPVPNTTDQYFTADEWAPQDYGVNVIPLYPSCSETQKKVSIKFKGHTEVNTAQAGWRYGFVTTKADGTVSRYSPMYADAEAEVSFSLDAATEAGIFFVVFSAPKIHENYNIDVGFPKQRRYPFELKIANAAPEGYQTPADFRKFLKTNGRIHANGGGWVSNSANVDASVYVGPYAIVRRGTVTGNVRIEGHAMVDGGTIGGDAILRGNACVYNTNISGKALLEGNAWMEGGSVAENATVRGNAFIFGSAFGGSVLVGGEAEIGSCSGSGVYMQFPYYRNGRSDCDGKGATDASNVDINPSFTNFSVAQMAFSTPPTCSDIAVKTFTLTTTVVGSGTVSPSAGTFNEASVQTLTATPATGYVFAGWSGDATGTTIPQQVTMNANKSITATFAAIPNETLTYNIAMNPLTDYTPTRVKLDADKISAAFGMTAAQISAALGSTIMYSAIEPNGALNATSTANAPGHWFTNTGATVVWGNTAYIFSELNLATLEANIGQYPNKCAAGEQYAVKQTLIYTKSATEAMQITLVFNISINTVQTIALSPGWNLISTNVHPADSSIATLFNGLDVAEIKDMNTYWQKDQPSFLNLLQTITAGEGYLVKMNAAGTLAVSGTHCTGVLQYAPTGWQLIGCPYPTATPISGILGSKFPEAKDFDGFWMPNEAASSIENLEPGKGYFIKN
jgi:uncharacterized repeat protein (TIGR02543 family)